MFAGAYRDTLWLQVFNERCGVLQHKDKDFQSIGGIDNLSPHATARKWKPVNAADIKAFVGIIMYMGLLRLPTYALYCCIGQTVGFWIWG